MGPVAVDDTEVEYRMEVVNYCIQHGVFKTQKHFKVTRQSIIDLMTEYDELNRYALTAATQQRRAPSLKTKLVSREKTSVEDGSQEPVFVTNLQDYIVTEEYKLNVAEYASEHGVTAATRKFKRKSSTVKSWMGQFGKKAPDVIIPTPKYPKGDLSAHKFEVVGYAKENGITAAARKYKVLSVRVKSWMGHHAKLMREQKKMDSDQSNSSQLKLIVPDDVSQKGITSPVWDQDFIIKPNTNSPLKLTLSPRRKSPVISLLSDDVNDIETEDECEEGNADNFEEFATWDIDAEKENKSERKSEKKEEIKSNNENETVEEFDVVEKRKLLQVNKDTFDHQVNEKEQIMTADACVTESVKDMVDKVVSMEQDRIGSEKKAIEKLDNEAELRVESVDVKEIGEESQKEQKRNEKPIKGSDIPVSVENDDGDDNIALVEDCTEPNEESEFYTDPAVEDDEEVEKIPFEKTILFHLQSNDTEINSFFNDVHTFQMISKDLPGQSVEKQAHKEKKPSPKKPRRYADFEIMKNIEETCIFSPERPRRTHEPPEIAKITEKEEVKSKLTDSTGMYSGMDKNDKETIDKSDKRNDLLDSTASEEHTDKNEKENSTNLNSMSTSQSNKDNQSGKKVLGNETPQRMEEIGDTQANPGRSLFDFLSFSEKSADTGPSSVLMNTPAEKQDTQATLENQVETKVSKDTSRSLFDSLFKNFKLPPKFEIKAAQSSDKEKSSGSTVDTMADERKEVKRDEVQEEKELQSKDRSERNLFDFLTPEPISVQKEETVMTKKDPSPVSSPVKPSSGLPLKPTGAGLGRKPMFKFPKLQLPVNFGSIAKLGMAKIKDDKIKASQKQEDEKDFDSKDKDHAHVFEDSPSKTDSCSLSKDDQTKTDNKPVSNPALVEDKLESMNAIKTQNMENGPDVGSKTETDKEGVVMETFEELRKRLAEERAKKRETETVEEGRVADLEVVDVSQNNEQGISVNNSGDQASKAAPKGSAEDIDYEMYKEFTPQKIVLILDISKKHGIEFASTSFDLPPSVIVNWIIEKDRKHRKIGAAFSLEAKLLAMQKIRDKGAHVTDIAGEYETSVSTVESWEEQVKWLLDSKGVLDVLNKWQGIRSVTSLHDNGKGMIDEGNKDMQSKSKTEDGMVNKHADTVDDSVEGTQNIHTSGLGINVDNANISNVNNQKTESELKTEVMEGKIETKDEQAHSFKLPKILSFVVDTLPREFTVEQKAMVVLLMDKYGLKEVHKKLGINKGTLWTWKNQNKIVKQFILEQTSGVRKRKVGVNSVDPDQPIKSDNDGQEQSVVMEDPTAAAETDGQTQEEPEEPSVMPTGYRYISPTKLPSSLKDTFKRPTREYSFEQRVAIVKLVELYGVRTVHKQFRIPCGSIWNWQHSESVLKELRRTDGKEETGSNSSKTAKCLNFDGDENRSDPFTIDLIMDRVFVAVESTEHVKFKNAQKADVVCLIKYFGLDYVCEKFPSIPRGTLWNWCYNNKNVQGIVDKNMQLLKKFDELMGKKGGFCDGEKVDKALMTQQWLNSCQQSGLSSKRKLQNQTGEGSSSGSSNKRWRQGYRGGQSELVGEDTADTTVESVYSSSRRSKRDAGHNLDGTQRDSSTDSSVSSISGHSNGFEEIVSDDEANAPSVYSRRSGASGRVSLTSKDSSSGRVGGGRQVYKSPKAQQWPGDGGEIGELEVLRVEQGAYNRLMVLYREIEKGG